MADHYSYLLETPVALTDGAHRAVVEAIIDEEAEYTGRYLVTIDGLQKTELQWQADDSWIETNKGKTELAAVVGQLISLHEE